ncbi:MAG: cytochrome ubiquinol oxidase subunit I, partial [Armatimonadota bacterium]|nr:cytochrome ubiquinol oxidase subunit I [Armatimonadota bacterium]
MSDPTMVSAARAQFTFTIMFHYLFPILTMGLAVLIAGLKTVQLVRHDDRYGAAARFWAHIFAINFAVGVVTGIPMEFQFGTNWAVFSAFAGGVIGQPLVMEGAYAFFLESGFLGLFLFGEGRVSPVVHWLASVLVAVGALVSGFFICATNAWMQHPVGYTIGADHTVKMTSLWQVLANPFAGWQYAHAIVGSLSTASIVMAGTGAYYALMHKHPDFARICIRTGVICGLVFSLLQLFPTGDMNGANVTRFQPVKLAAMEGLFHSEKGASLAIIGMPDEDKKRLIDPIQVPKMLSFLAYGNASASVKGLDEYPASATPPIAVTYYAYHIMVGLGTIFIGVMTLGGLLLWRDRIFRSRWFLWILMLLVPFPYIANEAGWTVTEVGRQPWIIYGLQ